MSGDSPGEPAAHDVRLIAFYLPQFHPEPANDGHHGPGFTEWVHVAGAQPLFRGHQQPVLPGELGFYDLRVPEVREAQAALARQYGISAFCWWHYWSLGRRLLDRPFREVLESGEPDFPFCLGWANHGWATDRSGAPESIVVAQEYGGDDDHARHFAALEPAFHDPRYVRVGGAPLFYLFRPLEVPDLPALVAQWRKLAHQSGLPGIHFVGQWRGEAIRANETPWTALDALVVARIVAAGYRRRLRLRVVDRLRHGPIRLPPDAYAAVKPELVPGCPTSYPCVLTNWDDTPRWGRRGYVLVDPDADDLSEHVRTAVRLVADRAPDERIVFVKSWNEWAEGNHLEPDRRHGRRRLEAVLAGLAESSGGST